MSELGNWPLPDKASWFSLKIMAMVMAGSLLILPVVFAAAFGWKSLAVQSTPVNFYIALAGMLSVPLAWWLPRFLVDRYSIELASQMKSGDASFGQLNLDEMFNLFRSRSLLAMAMIETFTVLNVTLYFAAGFEAPSLLAYLFTAGSFLLFMPTRNRWFAWMDRITSRAS